MSKPVSICVIGSGYVGLVAAVCFAEIGHRVVCVDNDEARVKTLREGGVPIFERHLPELLARHLNRGVEFTSDLAAAVEQSEAIFIAVGTPQGDTGAADLSYVEAVVSEIARAIGSYKVIVEKSTVPVYTNDWIRRVLHRHGVDPQNFDVVSNPEFLREGTAIIDFLHPDRIVVGAGTERCRRCAASASMSRSPLAAITRSPDALPGLAALQSPARLLVTSAQSAEIVKHASNAFLALKISFINAVANLAESVDADIEDIAAGMGLDSRIGPKFLRAGLGYGGSCFPKDVAAFHWVAQQQGVDFQLLEEVRKINETQKDIFFNKVLSALWTLRGKRLAALGLAFKGRYRRYSRVPRHRHDQQTPRSRRHRYGLRSRRHGARQGRAAALGETQLCARHLRSGQGRRRGADSDRLEGVCRDRSGAAQPGGPLPHRHRRPQPLQAARYAGPRLYICERGPAGKLSGAAGQAASHGYSSLGYSRLAVELFYKPDD